MNITIRPERPADIQHIHDVNTEAFGQENEAVLVDKIRAAPGFVSELSLVAECEGGVIGHILFSPVHIDSGDIIKPALALAPMAVRPDMQRTGIGSQLVRHGLEDCRRLGWDGSLPPSPPDTREQVADPRSVYQVVSMLQGVVQRGMRIAQIRQPLGVVGIIYESRPNVTADAAGLWAACREAASAFATSAAAT